MTVRGAFILAVRLHVVEHPGFEGVMENAVSLWKTRLLPPENSAAKPGEVQRELLL